MGATVAAAAAVGLILLLPSAHPRGSVAVRAPARERGWGDVNRWDPRAGAVRSPPPPGRRIAGGGKKGDVGPGSERTAGDDKKREKDHPKTKAKGTKKYGAQRNSENGGKSNGDKKTEKGPPKKAKAGDKAGKRNGGDKDQERSGENISIGTTKETNTITDPKDIPLGMMPRKKNPDNKGIEDKRVKERENVSDQEDKKAKGGVAADEGPRDATRPKYDPDKGTHHDGAPSRPNQDQDATPTRPPLPLTIPPPGLPSRNPTQEVPAHQPTLRPTNEPTTAPLGASSPSAAPGATTATELPTIISTIPPTVLPMNRITSTPTVSPAVQPTDAGGTAAPSTEILTTAPSVGPAPTASPGKASRPPTPPPKQAHNSSASQQDIDSFFVELSVAVSEDGLEGPSSLGRVKPLLARAGGSPQPHAIVVGEARHEDLWGVVLPSLAEVIESGLGYIVAGRRRMVTLEHVPEGMASAAISVADLPGDGAGGGPDWVWVSFRVAYRISSFAAPDGAFNASEAASVLPTTTTMAGGAIAADVYDEVRRSILDGTLLAALRSRDARIVAVSAVGDEAAAAGPSLGGPTQAPPLTATEPGNTLRPLDPGPFDSLRIAGVLLFVAALAGSVKLVRLSRRRRRERGEDAEVWRAELRTEAGVDHFLGITRGRAGHESTHVDPAHPSSGDGAAGTMFVGGGPLGLADRSEEYQSSSVPSLAEAGEECRGCSVAGMLEVDSGGCKFSINSAVYT